MGTERDLRLAGAPEQNLATSVFIDDVVGYWALGSLYIVFALASLVAGRIVRFTGRR